MNLFHVKQIDDISELGEILSQHKGEVYQRTETGEAEIRQRAMSLSKAEQMVLLSINGKASFDVLRREFEKDDSLDFQKSVDSLLSKGFIVRDSSVPLFNDSDLMTAQVEQFSSEEFFSSSMDPLHSGSGLVVDTRSNSMRSVNLKRKKQESVYDVDIPLSLELDTSQRLKKSKRSSKLVEVFPNPEKRKRRRRSKRPATQSVNRWQLWIYVGLTVIGLALVLIALLAEI